MKNRIVKVSEFLRLKLLTLGADGTRWLDGLADLVAELEQDWQISVGKSLEGGSESFVAEARTAEGAKVILKIGMPEMSGIPFWLMR
jgi:streptomycin 6-kinase